MTEKTKKLTLAGLFLALAILLPMLFHLTGIPGQVFLPMHIPVLLCGFICSKKYGAITGAVSPLIGTALTGMPVLYPVGISMVFELMAYGFISGLLYEKTQKVMPSLLGAMLAGRVVSGIVRYLILVPFGGAFVFKAFITASIVTSVWGMVIQIILVPLVVKAYERLKVS
jgi:ECF transporter S component (folate family)